jgi:hypothetical protein
MNPPRTARTMIANTIHTVEDAPFDAVWPVEQWGV